MIQPNTGIETHPAGTTNVGGIINANWERIEELFSPTLSGSDPNASAFAKALVRSNTLPTTPARLEWDTAANKPIFRPVLTSPAYSGTLALDANGAINVFQALAGDLTVSFTDLAAGREFGVILEADASARALTWPTGVRWLGAAEPTSLPAGKLLRVRFLSTTAAATGVVASWEIEP